jgi:hypothetical protein
LTATVTVGATLALLYLRGVVKPIAGVLHGLLGVTGLGLLILALRGPRHGDAMGVGSFGITAAVLVGVALTIGPFIPLSAKRSPRVAGVVIATHATLAITGFVLLLAWTSLG